MKTTPLLLAVYWLFAVIPVSADTDYLGSEVCARCHQAAFDSWRNSHYDLAKTGEGRRATLVSSLPGSEDRSRQSVVLDPIEPLYQVNLVRAVIAG